MRKEWKVKLNDLEIDIKELTYLLDVLDEEPTLARSVKRLVDLMKERLDDIRDELDRPVKAETTPTEQATAYIKEEDVVKGESAILEKAVVTSDIVVLGEQLRPALHLSKGLTLNDSFRFSRELFNGDNEKMNKVLQEISMMNSLADVMSYLSTQIDWDEENDATQDFIELLKNYFV